MPAPSLLFPCKIKKARQCGSLTTYSKHTGQPWMHMERLQYVSLACCLFYASCMVSNLTLLMPQTTAMHWRPVYMVKCMVCLIKRLRQWCTTTCTCGGYPLQLALVVLFLVALAHILHAHIAASTGWWWWCLDYYSHKTELLHVCPRWTHIWCVTVAAWLGCCWQICDQ